jgi:hypothetical protein
MDCSFLGGAHPFVRMGEPSMIVLFLLFLAVAFYFAATGQFSSLLSFAYSQQTKDLATAISIAEGFGEPEAIPTLANNPGDLELGNVGNGTLGEGITVYSSVSEGWAALWAQVEMMLSGTDLNYPASLTWSQVGALYAGDSIAWPANVVAQLNQLGYPVSIDDTLGDFAAGIYGNASS